jgi:hypothetical protein
MIYSYNKFLYKKTIKQVNTQIYYIKMPKKINILKISYKKKIYNFAYLMWQIFQKN